MAVPRVMRRKCLPANAENFLLLVRDEKGWHPKFDFEPRNIHRQQRAEKVSPTAEKSGVQRDRLLRGSLLTYC